MIAYESLENEIAGGKKNTGQSDPNKKAFRYQRDYFKRKIEGDKRYKGGDHNSEPLTEKPSSCSYGSF